jgi:hypothetical protein
MAKKDTDIVEVMRAKQMFREILKWLSIRNDCSSDEVCANLLKCLKEIMKDIDEKEKI